MYSECGCCWLWGKKWHFVHRSAMPLHITSRKQSVPAVSELKQIEIQWWYIPLPPVFCFSLARLFIQTHTYTVHTYTDTHSTTVSAPVARETAIPGLWPRRFGTVFQPPTSPTKAGEMAAVGQLFLSDPSLKPQPSPHYQHSVHSIVGTKTRRSMSYNNLRLQNEKQSPHKCWWCWLHLALSGWQFNFV